MSTKVAVNADPSVVVSLQTNELPWLPSEFPGVEEKVLVRVIDPRKGRATLLMKFSPGARLPSETLKQRVDIFVVEGSCSDGIGDYGQYTFVRNSPGSRHCPMSAAKATRSRSAPNFVARRARRQRSVCLSHRNGVPSHQERLLHHDHAGVWADGLFHRRIARALWRRRRAHGERAQYTVRLPAVLQQPRLLLHRAGISARRCVKQ